MKKPLAVGDRVKYGLYRGFVKSINATHIVIEPEIGAGATYTIPRVRRLKPRKVKRICRRVKRSVLIDPLGAVWTGDHPPKDFPGPNWKEIVLQELLPGEAILSRARVIEAMDHRGLATWAPDVCNDLGLPEEK